MTSSCFKVICSFLVTVMIAIDYCFVLAQFKRPVGSSTRRESLLKRRTLGRRSTSSNCTSKTEETKSLGKKRKCTQLNCNNFSKIPDQNNQSHVESDEEDVIQRNLPAFRGIGKHYLVHIYC